MGKEDLYRGGSTWCSNFNREKQKCAFTNKYPCFKKPITVGEVEAKIEECRIKCEGSQFTMSSNDLLKRST
jgi:hypothetical protein